MKSAVPAPSQISLRPQAPHVRAVVGGVAQPKKLEPPPLPAVHVRAAVAQARLPVAPPLLPAPQRLQHPVSHVQAAVAQAKVLPVPALPARRPPEAVPLPRLRPENLRLVPQIVQPYTAHGTDKVSASTNYAVRAHSNRLLIRVGSGAAPPNVYNWNWQPIGGTVAINGVNYQPHQAVQANATGVALPSDCIKAAQIVMGGVRSAAGTAVADLDGLAEPNYRRGGSVSGALGAQPPVGSAYLIVHSRTAGDFHTAAVILHDGTDNITLEADVDDPMTFRQSNLLFDMYNEAVGGQSFWANQGGSATDRVWRVDLPNAARGAGNGTLVGDIEDRMSNAQRTRLGQVMA